MGVSSHYLVSDEQLTSSSFIDDRHKAFDGRIYNSKSWIPGWVNKSKNKRICFSFFIVMMKNVVEQLICGPSLHVL